MPSTLTPASIISCVRPAGAVRMLLSAGLLGAALSGQAQVAPPPPPPVRLNAGGDAQPTTRGDFAADQYYSASSSTFATTAPISGTDDPALYQTERFSTTGTLRYAVPVPAGRYSVVLHFAEIYWTQPGQRVFSISLEGQTVRARYDIVAKVGPNAATTETFAVNVTDGEFNLDLVVPYLDGGADQAKLSALELTRTGDAILSTRGDASLAANFHAYPNPAAGRFVLSYAAPAAQAATLALTDNLGREVLRQPVRLRAGANQVPVPAAGLAAGLYQLTLRTADGQRLTSKVSLRP